MDNRDKGVQYLYFCICLNFPLIVKMLNVNPVFFLFKRRKQRHDFHKDYVTLQDLFTWEINPPTCPDKSLASTSNSSSLLAPQVINYQILLILSAALALPCTFPLSLTLKKSYTSLCVTKSTVEKSPNLGCQTSFPDLSLISLTESDLFPPLNIMVLITVSLQIQ